MTGIICLNGPVIRSFMHTIHMFIHRHLTVFDLILLVFNDFVRVIHNRNIEYSTYISCIFHLPDLSYDPDSDPSVEGFRQIEAGPGVERPVGKAAGQP